MHNYPIRLFVKLFFCFSLTLLANNRLLAQSIEGYVFVDSNNNSIMDFDEKGLKGVMVSNQKDVVLTDEKGHFLIKLIEGNYVFVTKPETYQFKLDDYYNPEFYFLYKTKRINQKLHYLSSEIITKIPDTLYFPVYENPGEETHSCLLVGDPQITDDLELKYYKEGIIPLMANKKTDFYIELGDIANNHLEILPKEKKVSSSLKIPGYRVFGNHDVNYLATINKHASETFKMVYGPDYYSFDYGSFHYIILNDIIYEGWQKELYRSGNYFGGLTLEQKKWLGNDLMHVPYQKTIVLLSHIPLHENFVLKKDMKTIAKVLKNHKKIISVSGHLHAIIAYDYSGFSNSESDTDFEGLVVGAASGSWWKEPMDNKGIPVSVCLDGSPKGFFQLNAKEDSYNYVFHSANNPLDLQMTTFISKDEIWINWFVGKRTDSVWVYIDDNPQAIRLQNFIGKMPVIESANNTQQTNIKVTETAETSHLWKAKLPEGLKTGAHNIRVIAKDSKGKLFYTDKNFMINDR